MGYPNGRFPRSALTEVENGNYLAIGTARAWIKAKAAVKNDLGRTISIADPAGAYRSYATQADMHVHPERYNLNPNSGANLAAPGYSKHGLGLCVDVIGSAIDSRLIAALRKFGFTRPLSNDPNHFLHDGKTAVAAAPVKTPTPAAPASSVKVKAGQTLYKIADLYDISMAKLLVLNPSVSSPSDYKVGDVIRVR